MDPRSLFDEKLNSSAIRIAVVGVLAVLALFLFAETMKIVQDFGRTDTTGVATISITGTGKASAVPNIAQISFTVQESESTVAAAQSAATKRTNDALAALKKLGIDDKDVKTSGYNVSPEYAPSRTCPPGYACPQEVTKIIGYRVSQTIEVKVRDTTKTGEVLQALGTLGVQNIYGPNFMVEDESQVQSLARGKAILDAHSKADMLARQLGVHLGKVVSFSESGAMPYPLYGLGGAAKTATLDSSTAPSVPVGENEVTATVTVTYEIR